MDIVDRVKKICLTPGTEWPVIAGEATPTSNLITGYVVPLAAVAAVAGFIGGSLVGQSLPFIGTYRVPVATGIGAAVLAVVMAVIGVFVISLIINALAPTFGAEKNHAQALKVAAYSFTPAWVAGVFQILPVLGFLALLGGLYGIYLLYLGLPRLMKCPEEKAVAYTAVVVVCAVVVMFVIGTVTGLVAGAGTLGAGLGRGATAPAVEIDRNSPLGQLGQIGQQIEESARRMEEAEQRGDQAAQLSAAMEGLGALLGGGRGVEPLDIAQLRPFVPETFAGLPRTSNSAERTGLAGIMIAKAEATYADGARSVTLQVTDTGGVSGLMGLASWAGMQSEREDDDGFERTRRVGDRLIHERSSRQGADEFAIVLGDRFLVSATGRGVDIDELRTAVTGMNLAQLESLRNAGAN